MTARTIGCALGTAALALALSGCGRSVRKPVQQSTSPDGHFRAYVHMDEGSAVIGGDWYAVVIAVAHSPWFEVLPRMREAGLCTLQGRGSVSVAWAAPRELVVTCAACDRHEFFIRRREWEGVKITYRFKPAPASNGGNKRPAPKGAHRQARGPQPTATARAHRGWPAIDPNLGTPRATRRRPPRDRAEGVGASSAET